ncbi:MAG: hypothetical protein ACE5OZ_13750 [Candidatus Heimdallarchaeota archaeon]
MKDSKDFLFTELQVDVYLTVPTKDDITKVQRALELTKKHCLVTNSMISELKIVPHIRVDS